MNSRPTGVTWNSLKRKQPKTKYICYIYLYHYEVFFKKNLRRHKLILIQTFWVLSMSYLAAEHRAHTCSTALRKHRRKRWKVQAHRCRTVGSSQLTLPTYQNRSQKKKETQAKTTHGNHGAMSSFNSYSEKLWSYLYNLYSENHTVI